MNFFIGLAPTEEARRRLLASDAQALRHVVADIVRNLPFLVVLVPVTGLRPVGRLVGEQDPANTQEIHLALAEHAGVGLRRAAIVGLDLIGVHDLPVAFRDRHLGVGHQVAQSIYAAAALVELERHVEFHELDQVVDHLEHQRHDVPLYLAEAFELALDVLLLCLLVGDDAFEVLVVDPRAVEPLRRHPVFPEQLARFVGELRDAGLRAGRVLHGCLLLRKRRVQGPLLRGSGRHRQQHCQRQDRKRTRAPSPVVVHEDLVTWKSDETGRRWGSPREATKTSRNLDR
jgi:hypothetical protein